MEVDGEASETDGEASEMLIHGAWCVCFLERVPEGLPEELGETSYQIYSAAKGIILKLEWATVSIDFSFFICLKFFNKVCCICNDVYVTY